MVNPVAVFRILLTSLQSRDFVMNLPGTGRDYESSLRVRFTAFTQNLPAQDFVLLRWSVDGCHPHLLPHSRNSQLAQQQAEARRTQHRLNIMLTTVAILGAILTSKSDQSLTPNFVRFPGRTLYSIKGKDTSGKVSLFALVFDLEKSFLIRGRSSSERLFFGTKSFKFQEVGSVDDYPLTSPTVSEFDQEDGVDGVLGSDAFDQISMELDQRSETVKPIDEGEVEQLITSYSSESIIFLTSRSPRDLFEELKENKQIRAYVSDSPLEISFYGSRGRLHPKRGAKAGAAVFSDFVRKGYPTLYGLLSDKTKHESIELANLPFHRAVWWSRGQMLILIDPVNMPLVSFIRSILPFPVDEKDCKLLLEISVDGEPKWRNITHINNRSVADLKMLIKKKKVVECSDFIIKSVREGLLLSEEAVAEIGGRTFQFEPFPSFLTL